MTTTRLPNPFSKPEVLKRRVKALAWGDTGAGKTYLGLTAPGPIAAIDLEGGVIPYVGAPWASPFDHLGTKDNVEVRQAIAFLATGQHEYETVLVDPVTVLWDVLQDAQAIRRQLRSGEDADFQRLDWSKVKRLYKAAMSDLVNLPMNVIVMARESVLYTGDGNNLRAVGVKPDAEKGTSYWFDVVLHLTKDRGQRSVTFDKDRLTGRDGQTEVLGDRPFQQLFGEWLAGSTGTAERHVQSDNEAAQSTAAGMDANTRAGVAGPALAARVVEALEAIGQDPEAIRASKLGDTPWAEGPREAVETILARAEAKLAKDTEQGKAETAADDAEANTAGPAQDVDQEAVAAAADAQDEPTPITTKGRGRGRQQQEA